MFLIKSTLLQDFKALQLKNSQNEVTMAQMQGLLQENHNKIEELQKTIDSITSTLQKPPETIQQPIATPELNSPSPVQEDIISMASNHEQNINFIGNGIIEQIVPDDDDQVNQKNEKNAVYIVL